MIRRFACFSAAALLTSSLTLAQVVTSYTIVEGGVSPPASGGQGIFCPVTGTFDVVLAGNQLSFVNVNIAGGCPQCSGFFPAYPATLTGSSFVAQDTSCPGVPPMQYSGSLSGASIAFSGNYYPACVVSAACGYGFVAQQEPKRVPTASGAGLGLLAVSLALAGLFLARSNTREARA